MTQKKQASKRKVAKFNSLKEVIPRKGAQEQYLESIKSNSVTFGVGLAGTGKTLLAAYAALYNLWNKKTTGISRIILTRPAVEAGEKLGFLPGLLEDKLDPYMRPLYDAMYDIAGISVIQDKIAKGVIEIAPIAYLRGRNFSNCFIILDEAQNCTVSQLKMALTRIGENTKMVITGDPGQSDINGKSGLEKMCEALQEVKGVGNVRFQNSDVARSEIVSNILKAFEEKGL